MPITATFFISSAFIHAAVIDIGRFCGQGNGNGSSSSPSVRPSREPSHCSCTSLIHGTTAATEPGQGMSPGGGGIAFAL